jgi:uncharacterized protein (DUF433 family)
MRLKAWPQAACIPEMRPCYNPYMSLPDRITLDPEVLAGKPVIRGTRLAVELVLELLAAGQKETDILESYPGLVHADILACLEYAHRLAQEHSIYSLSK